MRYLFCEHVLKMSGSDTKGKRKIAVYTDNPPLPGKKFFLVSTISPDGPRQKGDVHGFKIHDMCETAEEADELGEYYRDIDPIFDVRRGVVGKWIPWVFEDDSEMDIRYANEQLTNLVKSHRMQKSSSNKQWHQKVEKHIEEIRYAGTREGQEELAKKKEPVEAFYFKIQQLKHTIKRRKEELENLEEVFHSNYTKDERNMAKKAELPFTEPAPMQYTLLGATEDQAESRFQKPPESEELETVQRELEQGSSSQI